MTETMLDYVWDDRVTPGYFNADIVTGSKNHEHAITEVSCNVSRKCPETRLGVLK